MNVEIIAPCINYYTNVYDANKFIDLIEKESESSWARLDWSQSTIMTDQGNIPNDYRSSLSMDLNLIISESNLIELKEIQNEFIDIFKKIDECIWDYRNCYSLFLSSHEGIAVLKYSNGAEYRLHSDAGAGESALRTMSLVAYFNDDYDGGEIEFPLFNVKLKPEAGSVILFPSSYAYQHIANQVNTGTKYCLVTWFRQ